MDKQTLIIVLIPCLLTTIVALTNIIVSFLRDRQKKRDMSWETAKEIILQFDPQNCYLDNEREVQDKVISFYYLYKYLKKSKIMNLKEF